MKFNWGKYVELADFLSNAPTDDKQACYRAALSRAYYGIYGLSCGVVEEDGKELTNSGGDHYIVKDHLKKHRDKKIKKVGNILDMLHEKRKRADYKDEVKIPQKTTKFVVKRAQKALKIIDNI